jgi:hypothetical protein
MNNKKKALLCINSFYPFPNANTNASFVVIHELIKKYNLDVLAIGNDSCTKKYKYQSSSVFFTKKDGIFLSKVLSCSCKSTESNNILKKALLFFERKIARMAINFSNYSKQLHSMLKKEKYDIIFSVSAPFQIHLPILNLKSHHRFKWVCILQDPYSTYLPFYPIAKELTRIENSVYKKSDLILVSEALYKENINNSREKFLFKTKILNFGNMCAVKQKINRTNHILPIKCLFAGSIFDYRIRNPESAFSILNRANKNISCSFLINNFSQKVINSFEKINQNQNVSLQFSVPQDDAIKMMDTADILINIGNGVENQIPSKIFEYIAMGKPIVNFYVLGNDLAKKLLESYPLALNLSLNFSTIDDCVALFNDFCTTNYRKRLSENEIFIFYPNYSYHSIKEKFLSFIDKF